ncbi:helix-hairpin-helix domain-containing protein [Tenacibaculum sp. S7007]|uniref:Helix-hairpin-helix domain-containing protein n=1 Tax=Tenacibaculum pelagium TaxID=2759527 RepID=A0A839APF5_9FLAO|nr:helix-hairpin-helix domain-containing protein [Tenacibaculum pelagium]MBA6156397.1 helix-hairpin-helix domain-containing protein [Tenacibaculum pelagium]
MKIFKSHFWYNKRQRNGIFFLLLLIVILQAIYVYVDFFSKNQIAIEGEELLAFTEELDSLKRIELEKRKPKIYPFNPNFITDFKGYQLGMSIEEIDRLHSFRKKNRYVNSIKEFQEVTKVSDTLLNKISPYFKFPDWVVKRNQQNQKKKQSLKSNISIESKKDFLKEISKESRTISTSDINKATQQDFETVNGVGEVISERIIKYRNKLQGYSYSSQLYEVSRLEKSTIKEILKVFKIYQKPTIQKINVNTATFKQVLKNPYIDYELCKKIFEYRDEVAELQQISELRNIKDFPLDKYERIVLYLDAK